jgi:hypothetical protein
VSASASSASTRVRPRSVHLRSAQRSRVDVRRDRPTWPSAPSSLSRSS